MRRDRNCSHDLAPSFGSKSSALSVDCFKLDVTIAQSMTKLKKPVGLNSSLLGMKL